jgi:hypothetical protein
MRRREVKNLFMAALMSGALCFSGTNCGAAKVQGPQTTDSKAGNESRATAVTLTPDHPADSFPVEANVLTNDTEVLEVVITKVVNPSRTSVVMFVSLSNSVKGKSEPEKISIGNFSLYPADRPGTFLLNPAPALRKLSNDKPSLNPDVRLVIELKRIDETAAWTPVAVTVAQPKWRPREK